MIVGKKKFVGEVNKVNPYAIVRDMLGKEKEEISMPTPRGAFAIREWDGVTVVRRIEWDFEKGKFVMTDEVTVDEEKYPELVKKLKEAKLKEAV
jgi:hypothetical protein